MTAINAPPWFAAACVRFSTNLSICLCVYKMNNGSQALQSGFFVSNTQDSNLGAMKSSGAADNSVGILKHNHAH